MPLYTSVNIPVLTYANTFGDWVVTTDNLIVQNNNWTANNFLKPSGTLYLGDGTLGLQVNTAAIVAGYFQVAGTGSSAYIQNNLTVNGQVYLSNTTLGLINSGQANILGTLFATNTNTGLYVVNNAIIGGTTTMTGNVTIGANETVAGNVSIGQSISIAKNSYVGNVYANSSITVPNLTVTGNIIGTGANVNFNNITAAGSFTVQGAFILNGTTQYNTNQFMLDAASGALTDYSYYSVYRAGSANASIRWNGTNSYWDILDVNNSTYYRILTTEQLTGSSSTQSQVLGASAWALANTQSYAASAYALANTAITTTGSAQAIAGALTLQNTMWAQQGYEAGPSVATQIIDRNGNWIGPALPVTANTTFSQAFLTPTLVTNAGSGLQNYIVPTLWNFNATNGNMYVNGYVGIGGGVSTAAPTQALDVFGTIRARSSTTYPGVFLGSGQTINQSTGILNASAPNTTANSFLVIADGRICGTNIHNNANSITQASTTNQEIASGNQGSPTVTIVTGNISSGGSAPNCINAYWTRIGNIVRVSVEITFYTYNASGVAVLSLPVPILSVVQFARGSGYVWPNAGAGVAPGPFVGVVNEGLSGIDANNVYFSFSLVGLGGNQNTIFADYTYSLV